MSADDAQGEAESLPPTAEAVFADLVAPPAESLALETRYEEHFTVQAVEAERALAHLIGLRDHFRHKKLWSWFLMALMGFMVGFQSWLIYRVGIGFWDFKDYAWLLPTLMIQYLLQVAGLAYIAVRSLFKDLN
ncbi:hypothetical protein [Phenylobacterium sp.]|uniref:hypothetical protein n=1 Tax=Phenylobacterium sp. TaxID=1871053 RepID=UPI003D278F1B